MTVRRGRVALVVGLLLFGVLASGCDLWYPIDAHFDGQPLTSDAGDHYALSSTGGTVTVTAALTNTGGNDRGLFWPDGQKPALDAESCATWSSQDGGTAQTTAIQQGAALRVWTSLDGVTSAITVTKNVFGDVLYVFNEHVWNTGASPVFTEIGNVNLAGVFGASTSRGTLLTARPLPWDLCAQVVGRTLSFVAWLHGHPKPAYGDPTHGGSVTLPAGYNHAGNYGWYAGHLEPGETVTFTNLTAQATFTLGSWLPAAFAPASQG